MSFDDVCASHAQTTVVQPAGRECGYPGGVMASFTRQRSVFRSWASSAVMTASDILLSGGHPAGGPPTAQQGRLTLP